MEHKQVGASESRQGLSLDDWFENSQSTLS